MMHYATNHDEYVNASPVTLYGGEEGAYAAFALAALYGGNPLAYDGEEIAWPNRIPFFTRSALDWNTGENFHRQVYRSARSPSQTSSPAAGRLKEFGNDDVIAFTRTLKGPPPQSS